MSPHMALSISGKTRKFLPNILMAVGIVTVSVSSVTFMIRKYQRTNLKWLWIYWTPLLKFHKLRSIDWENDLWIITKEACKSWHILKQEAGSQIYRLRKTMNNPRSQDILLQVWYSYTVPGLSITSRSEYMNEWRKLENCSVKKRIGLLSP